MNTKFEIIYADPPWDYKGQRQHGGAKREESGGAEVHYPTVPLARLKALDVRSVCAPNCLLYLWTTGPHLDQAINLMGAWGFTYVTIGFVWDKVKVNPGYYTMSQCEFVLVGRRGKIPQPRGARNIRQHFRKMRGEHSVKPEGIRARIEAMFPTQAKLELFARREAPGWSVWGNEVESDVVLPWLED